MTPEQIALGVEPFAAPALEPGVIDLTAWQIARTDAGSITDPATLRIAEEGWIAATAPGTVADALRAAGMWNWASPIAIDDHDWWYRCRFRCEQYASGAALDFDGLASLADIWLNGQHILSSDNMFVAHEVDVNDSLARDNELIIRFASLNSALAVRRPRPRWRTRLVGNQNLRWFRTTLLGRMPGWSPAPQTVGPWKRVALRSRFVTRVVARRVRARLDGSDGVVSVTARLHAAPGTTVTAANVIVGGIERRAIVRWTDTDFTVHATVRVPDAAVWWPHTHGDQPLYDAAMRIIAGDFEFDLPLGHVAFRTIRLDSEDDEFALQINGERIFWRGACWSPPDPLRLHCTRAEYRRTLELARDAGMNMIRVGGTMTYEHDDFYDLCDELGIAVWQDFMFSNMDYPVDDPTFATSVEREAIQLLQRIGDRPSLVLVCGNSEVEQQAAMLGRPSADWSNTLFSEKLPDLVVEHAGTVPYWRSSPSGGVLPFHVNAGDGHYFGYGPYLRPFSDVRASGVRFASEAMVLSNIPEPSFIDRMSCGAAGAGHHPDWKRGVPRDNGSGWDFEDVRDHYVKEIFNVDPLATRYSNQERYLALGRVAGGEMMARTVAEWRRAESSCSGALVWLYRDLCPGAGWGVLDHDGAPKAAYYYLARAYRPITVIMSDEGLNGITIHAINDRSTPITPELRLSLFRGSVPVGETAVRVRIPERTTVTLSADELIGSFTDVSYAYRFGTANHDAVVATLVDPDTGRQLAQSFHFPLGVGAARPATRLNAAVARMGDDTYVLTVTADELAIAVAVETPGWRPSDSYFNIAPGGERTVVLTASGAQTRLSGSVSALNSHTPCGFSA